MKPTRIEQTLEKLAGSPKKRMPDAATGSLLSAPTIENVVDEVVRTVQAVQYEMKTAAAPEKAMRLSRLVRVSSGLQARLTRVRTTLRSR